MIKGLNIDSLLLGLNLSYHPNIYIYIYILNLDFGGSLMVGWGRKKELNKI